MTALDQMMSAQMGWVTKLKLKRLVNAELKQLIKSMKHFAYFPSTGMERDMMGA